jgi:pimeloyl-ACP methyl ester carboxylesterase
VTDNLAVPHTQGVPEWVRTRDNRRLYAQVLGGPDPDSSAAVVFEGGAGATRSYWAGVQVLVAPVARTVVYDRAGLGRSEPDPVRRTLDRMADDLVDLLDHFSPGPFILVGHSGGGPIVRLAASRRPDLLAGLVLVDPIDEAADVVLSAKFRRNEQVALRVGKVLARLGLLRFLYGSLLAAAPADDVRADLRREAFAPNVIETHARQARTYLDEAEAWKTAPPDTGDLPITVISGGLALARDGMPEEVRAEANAAHSFRATQSPGGRHVIAERSRHTIPITEPQIVADEIARLAVTDSRFGRGR